VGDVFIAHIHAVTPHLLDSRLHVNGVPMYDGIEGEAKAAQLLLLALLERASDFAALAVVDTAGEAVTPFRVIELGQDAPAERLIVDVAHDVDCLSNPADFGQQCLGQFKRGEAGLATAARTDGREAGTASVPASGATPGARRHPEPD
jgi:hypothetical protein